MVYKLNMIFIMTYCLDFRTRVLSYKARHGLSFEVTAAHFCISKSSLVRWSHRLPPKTRRNKGSVKIDMDLLKDDVICYPDAYLHERASRQGVSIRGITHALKRLGVSYKKTLYHPKADAEKRILFKNKLDAYINNHHPIVYIGESGFAQNMMPRICQERTDIARLAPDVMAKKIGTQKGASM